MKKFTVFGLLLCGMVHAMNEKITHRLAEREKWAITAGLREPSESEQERMEIVKDHAKTMSWLSAGSLLLAATCFGIGAQSYSAETKLLTSLCGEVCCYCGLVTCVCGCCSWRKYRNERRSWGYK